MTRRGVVVLSLLVVVAGCGSRLAPVPPRELAGAPQPAAPEVAAAASEPAAPETVQGGPSNARREAERDRARLDHALDSQRHPDTALTAVAVKPCVAHGDTQIIRVQADPFAQLGFVIGYRDAAPHGSMAMEHADAQGRHDFTVTITPDIPPGAAVALVSSGGKRDGTGGASAHASFVVASPEGC